ncbi:hypothetical protein [Ignatzschineria indica]|uniref:hypothetical protein n=1 Tax=Ignatzschineria indica TaxID=472583 RepID=UPI001863C8F4|nr:hypothetical protein [Ignatzschineria indica]
MPANIATSMISYVETKKADEVPVFTTSCFQKFRAGSRRSFIVNNRYFNDIVLGIEDAK